jgi:recombination protein RecA
MASHFAALRSQIELHLAGRVPSPFTYHDRKLVETVPAGIPEIDSLTGGLPRGCLTEICGLSGSGRTSLLWSALAQRTAHAEACALVDGRDAFDPHSAQQAGVELKKLLWVRCCNIDQSLRAMDLLLRGGGFGLIAVDLADIPPETVRRVPLNVWFRFRRAVEDTPAILMVLEQEPNAKTCASLVLHLEVGHSRWSAAVEIPDADFCRYPFACLLDEYGARAGVIRSSIRPANSKFHEAGHNGEEHCGEKRNGGHRLEPLHRPFSAAPASSGSAIFLAKPVWSGGGGMQPNQERNRKRNE